MNKNRNDKNQRNTLHKHEMEWNRFEAFKACVCVCVCTGEVTKTKIAELPNGSKMCKGKQWKQFQTVSKFKFTFLAAETRGEFLWFFFFCFCCRFLCQDGVRVQAKQTKTLSWLLLCDWTEFELELWRLPTPLFSIDMDFCLFSFLGDASQFQISWELIRRGE